MRHSSLARGMLAAGVCLAAAWPHRLAAQAVVKGFIVADSTSSPLALADLQIEELGIRTTTDNLGRFRLDHIPLGTYRLRIRRIGFHSAVAPLRIEAADSVTVRIRMQAWIPTLEPLLVNAKPAMSSRDRAIVERQAEGWGKFAGFDWLRERDHVRLEDVLREMGVSVKYDTFKRPYPISRRISHLGLNGDITCPMSVYVNGVRAEEDLSRFPVVALGAIEVYPDGVSTPTEFSGLDGGCGAILLWTRDH